MRTHRLAVIKALRMYQCNRREDDYKLLEEAVRDALRDWQAEVDRDHITGAEKVAQELIGD